MNCLDVWSDSRPPSPPSRFGLPEVKRGMMANGGGVSRMKRLLPRNVALELIAAGEPFGAELAAGCGMVNRLAPAADVLETALCLARLIVANAPISVLESLRISRQASIEAFLQPPIWSQSLRTMLPQRFGPIPVPP